MKKVITVIVWICSAMPTLAGEMPPDARARAIAPYVDEQTIGIVRIDLSRLDIDALVSRFRELGKRDAEAVAPFRQAAGQWVRDFTKAGGKDIYFLVSVADLPQGETVVIPLTGEANGRAIVDLLESKSTDQLAPWVHLPLADEVLEKLDRAVIIGSKTFLTRVRAGKAAARPEIAEAFAAAGDSVAQLLLLPTADARRAVEEIMPRLPKGIGGEPSTTLTRGIQWAALSIDLSPRAGLRLVIQSQDAAAAEKLAAAIPRFYDALGAQTQLRLSLPQFDHLARLLTPRVTESRLTLNVDSRDEAIIKLLAVSEEKFTDAEGRKACAANLKEIVLALHNYLDMHRTFPAFANFDSNGKPLLSWRVHILPYLGQEALYKEFHLNEPWDSEHNKALIKRMPKVYSCPGAKGSLAGKTTYLGPVGAAMMFTGDSQGIQIKDVTDGTSNTIFVVDASDDRAVIWTKPDDLKIDAKDPLAGLVGHHPDGFNAAFADGSVHFIAKGVDKAVLHALFTRNGGEVVPFQ
ncbi:MAG TPA: DUF1559 domain-containing protein [Gemmataceae bacterium]|nr:DUF1559 domain-containing protein [Gemmataceae bacterium]